MPKLILEDSRELSCRAYVQDGVCFDGSFPFAKTVNDALKSSDPVRIVTDRGDTELIDLSEYTYVGDMEISSDDTFTAKLVKKEQSITQEQMQYINVAKILLGEETE